MAFQEPEMIESEFLINSGPEYVGQCHPGIRLNLSKSWASGSLDPWSLHYGNLDAGIQLHNLYFSSSLFDRCISPNADINFVKVAGAIFASQNLLRNVKCVWTVIPIELRANR
jgi:hypothetical protein